MKNNIEISTKTLVKVFAFMIGLWFLFTIREVFVILFISIIIVSALNPLVNKLETKKFPRFLSTLIIYLLFFSFTFFCVYLITPILLFELKQLGETIPEYFRNINQFLADLNALAINSNFEIDIQTLVNNVSESLAGLISRIFSNSLAFLGILLKVFIIFALAFYMLAKKNGLEGFLNFIVSRKNKKYATDLTKRVQNKIGNWMLGQISIAFIVFCLEFLVLSLLDVPYALLLALMGGLFEIIPYIGPFMSFVPAVLIGLTISPITGLLVAILYIVIQQTENHVLTPLIMKKAVGLDPVVIILSLIIGANLFGAIGMLIAIPTATALSVIIKDLHENKFLK